MTRGEYINASHLLVEVAAAVSLRTLEAVDALPATPPDASHPAAGRWATRSKTPNPSSPRCRHCLAQPASFAGSLSPYIPRLLNIFYLSALNVGPQSQAPQPRAQKRITRKDSHHIAKH